MRDFRFDYPSGWRILAEDITARHYDWIAVVVGTGDWKLNCFTTRTSETTTTTCGSDIFTVGPGEVVVELHSMDSPAHIDQSPPPAATVRPDGLAVALNDRGSSAVWAVYGIPGWYPPLLVEAHFGPDSSPQLRAQAEALVESLSLAKPFPASPGRPQTLITSWRVGESEPE